MIHEDFWEWSPGEHNDEPEEYCFNGKIDGTETDINCGGECLQFGQACREGYHCEETDDCWDGLICYIGTCTTLPDAVEEDIEQGGALVGSILIDYLVGSIIGIIILTLLFIFGSGFILKKVGVTK